MLAGLLKPTGGEVVFSTPGQDQADHQPGLPGCQPDALAHGAGKHHPAAWNLQGVPAEQAQARAREWIELVGLQGFENAWPGDLSGGMAQRVAIARSLIQDPDLLLLDEPFGALDALTREKMGAELLNLWQARRKTVLMVTHSISEALLLSDRVLVLTPRPGRIGLDLPVDLPRPREEEVRYTEHFGSLARKLKAAIK